MRSNISRIWLTELISSIFRAYDMLMMSLFNSREREEGDWTHLIQDADPRFRIVGARKPQEGTMGVIEVVWEG